MVMMMMMEIKREEKSRGDCKQRVTNKDSKILNGLVLLLPLPFRSTFRVIFYGCLHAFRHIWNFCLSFDFIPFHACVRVSVCVCEKHSSLNPQPI